MQCQFYIQIAQIMKISQSLWQRHFTVPSLRRFYVDVILLILRCKPGTVLNPFQNIPH